MEKLSVNVLVVWCLLASATPLKAADHVYTQWIRQNLLPTMPPAKPMDKVARLPVPLDVTIKSDSVFEQCNESHQPYCYPSPTSNARLSKKQSQRCPQGLPRIKCHSNSCTAQNVLPLQNYSISHLIAFYLPSSGALLNASLPECQITYQENRLSFQSLLKEENCSHADLQPFLRFSLSQKHTIQFTVEHKSPPFNK